MNMILVLRQLNHASFSISSSGFSISTQHPYIGTSPDGFVTCNCCGAGILEVKCPHYKQDKYIQEASEDKGFCLENKGDKLQLNHNHPYIYKIQTQLYATKGGYCDFVV